MSSAETRRRVRRGLLALLDGLVIAVLAAVITARGNGTGISDLAGATVGVLSTWLATPGVGTLEAIAYAGFAVALFGSLWFWVLRSVVGPVRLASFLPSRASDSADNDRSREASPVDRQDDRGRLSDGGDIFRTVLADEVESSGADWTEDVFGANTTTTMAVPEGDFLRGGSSGSDPDEPERRSRSLRATFGPPADGGTSRSVDIQKSPDESESPQKSTDPVVEAAFDANRTESSDSSEGKELDEDPRVAIEAEESAPEETETTSEADEPEPVPREPVDSLDQLGEQLSDSRARIGAVENQLVDATAPNGVETAQTALATRTGGDDDTARQLEDELSGRTPEIAEAIAEIRAEQATIESAFEATSQ